MGSYPQDFKVPLDQGGPGQDQSVGGFGGNPAIDQAAHRATVQRVGKAPVLLIHGNGGAANTGQWNMLDLQRMLNEAGYPNELVWAPSYLGSGTADLLTPHTDNVNEVREFIERVCDYLAVDVVDIIAHSLGCSLVYAVCRGLEKRTAPVNWNQPKQWQRVGTFVALAGAFHGLGPNGHGEWKTGAEFMNELLMEQLGDGGETPYGAGKSPTPPPVRHNITYFCGVARGDFIDAQNPGTGKLAGAINKDYNLGAGTVGHQKIKESQAVFDDFLPHLNLVSPASPMTITIDKATGRYTNPLTISLTVAPADTEVTFEANRGSKVFLNGFIADKVTETLQGTLTNGQTVTLATDGRWEIVFSAAGTADDITRTYWVGITAIDVVIVTDNTTPFEESLVVVATTATPSATLYHSLDGSTWNEGANVTITEDAVVCFIAIDPAGIASEVVSRLFHKHVAWDDAVTANANGHFIAGRIDVNEYWMYSRQFGFFTSFILYLVNDDWVLDPTQPSATRPPPTLAINPDSGTFAEPITVTVTARDAADPNQKIYYTTDGSQPTTRSPFFLGFGQITFDTSGTKTLKYFAQSASGNPTTVETKTYELAVATVRPSVRVQEGDPQPGVYRGAVTITIEAVDDRDDHVTVHYTRDGSLPDEHAPAFQDRQRFEFSAPGQHLVACYAQNSDGNATYETFCYTLHE